MRHYETTKAEAAAAGRHRLLRRQVRRHRAGARGRPALHRAVRRHPRPRPRRHRPGEDRVSESSIGANLRRIEAVTGTGPIDRLRAEEQVLAEVAGVLNVPVGEVVDGARKRLEEIKALRDEVKALKRQAAGGQAAALAAKAVDGVLVERVDGLERDTLRDLAVALRDQPGMRAVVLGTAPEGGGAALVAAVTPDSGLHAVGAPRGRQGAHQGRRRQGPAARGGRRQGRRRARRRPRLGPGRGGAAARAVRALGIDLGTKRIGVALADSAGTRRHALRGRAALAATGPATTAASPSWPPRRRPSSSSSACRSRSTAPWARRPRLRLDEVEELARRHRPARRHLGRAPHHRHRRP